MFQCLKSDSTACGHVCLGRPTGRIQSGDDFQIAADCPVMDLKGGAVCNVPKESQSSICYHYMKVADN